MLASRGDTYAHGAEPQRIPDAGDGGRRTRKGFHTLTIFHTFETKARSELSVMPRPPSPAPGRPCRAPTRDRPTAPSRPPRRRLLSRAQTPTANQRSLCVGGGSMPAIARRCGVVESVEAPPLESPFLDSVGGGALPRANEGEPPRPSTRARTATKTAMKMARPVRARASPPFSTTATTTTATMP